MTILNIKKTKSMKLIEEEFKGISLEFIGFQKRGSKKDYLFLWKFKNEKDCMAGCFTLYLNQRLQKRDVLQQIYKENLL